MHVRNCNLTNFAPLTEIYAIWPIITAHLECDSETEQNIWTRIYKGIELTLLFQALVGTFPSITTVLTDRALEACQILSHHLTKEI